MLFLVRGVFSVIAALLLAPVLLSARDVSRADFGQRAVETDERFSTQQRRFEVNENLANKRFKVQEWHKEYNTLGRKRANVDMTAREPEVIAHRTLSFDRVETSKSRFDGRQAYIRNFGEVERSRDARIHEDATVRRFDGPMREIRSELESEAEGELSMEDINRFFYMRNKRGDDGSGEIPVNQPGSAD